MKKFIYTFVIIIGIGLLIGSVFLFTHSSNSVGLDVNIQNENNKEGVTNLDSNRVLVLYFSETGNTQQLAKTISNLVGGDFRRIEPVTPYPSGNELFSVTEEERDTNARPKSQDLHIQLDDYDTIFVRYPIWWYTLPMIMYTFLKNMIFLEKLSYHLILMKALSTVVLTKQLPN